MLTLVLTLEHAHNARASDLLVPTSPGPLFLCLVVRFNSCSRVLINALVREQTHYVVVFFKILSRVVTKTIVKWWSLKQSTVASLKSFFMIREKKMAAWEQITR
jgi:hypothetical protein